VTREEETSTQEKIKKTSQRTTGMGLLFSPTLMMIILLLCVSGTHSALMLTKQPVLWRPSSTPVTSGHFEVKLLVKFESPCIILTNETIHQDILKEIITWCEEIYGELWTDEVEDMCPNEQTDTTSLTFNHNGEIIRIRKPRFILISTVLGIVSVCIVTGVALGISAQTTASVALTRTSALSARLDEAEELLEQKVKELKLSQEAIKIVQQNVRSIDTRLTALESDFGELKLKFPSTVYGISHINAKLLEANSMLKDTKRAWQEKKLNPAFFDYLKIELPCNNTCPIKFAIGKACRLSHDWTKLNLDFTVPIISDTLKLAEADPFTMIQKKNNQTCTIEYNGPHNVVFSTRENCIYGVNVNPTNILLSPSQVCRGPTSLPESSKYFSTGSCKPSFPGDEKDFIQVKEFGGMLHIYCAYNTITIGEMTEDSPLEIFALPLGVEFEINEQKYLGNVLNLKHKETTDTLFSLHTNWNLRPKVPSTGLIPDVDMVASTKSENSVIGTEHHGGLIVALIVTTMILFIIILLGLYYFVYKRQKVVVPPPKAIESPPQQAVETPIIIG